MKPVSHILIGLSIILLLAACSTRELQEFAFNTGAAVECRHANDNLPNEAGLDSDCIHRTSAEKPSYEDYMERRNEMSESKDIGGRL